MAYPSSLQGSDEDAWSYGDFLAATGLLLGEKMEVSCSLNSLNVVMWGGHQYFRLTFEKNKMKCYHLRDKDHFLVPSLDVCRKKWSCISDFVNTSTSSSQ